MPGSKHLRPWLDRLRRYGVVRYLDLDLVTGTQSTLDTRLLPYTLSVLFTFPLGVLGSSNDQLTRDGDDIVDCEASKCPGGSTTAPRRVAFVNVLERLRLSEIAVGPNSTNPFRVLKGEFFPALERLALIPWTRSAPDHDPPEAGAMADFSRRFPRLSYLALQCPRWDSRSWEPTLKNLASGPSALRSLYLSFHMMSEETVVGTISSALQEGCLAFLQDIGLRSTLDAYDGIDAMWDEQDPVVLAVSARAGVLYRNDKVLGTFGRSLGKLAPTLRRLEVCLRCANNARSSNFWTEMGDAAGPAGMLKLMRVSVRVVSESLLAVTELTKLAKLPALGSLEALCLRAILPDRPMRPAFGGKAYEERREAQLQDLRRRSAVSEATLSNGLSLVLSTLASGPSLSHLHTLSLGFEPATKCVGSKPQEEVAGLLVSGNIARLRRLWLFPQDAPLAAVEPADGSKMTQAETATGAGEPPQKKQALHQKNTRGHEARQHVLSRELRIALISTRCPPALTEAFVNDGIEALRRRTPQDWWGV